MCGILGVVGKSQVVAESSFDTMRDVMQHRGPDSGGTWISDDRCAMLGHRRLAIVDLSPDGHQPMASTNGRYIISFNGEIYNHRELRASLIKQGAKFNSGSDTEVLLWGYQIWGESCLDRLVGMFAFVIYDNSTRKVFIARDRAGEKPLFYAKLKNKFLFSSEMEPILRSGLVPREMSLTGLDQYLAYGHTIDSRTMIDGVERLPAGMKATYDPKEDRLTIDRYWSLPSESDHQECDPTRLLERLDDLLTTSISDQLVADVPVGVMLSGGIDSSLVAAIAAKVSQRRIKTFNVAFPGFGTLDESAHASRVAKHLGTDHITIDAPSVDPQSLFDLTEKFDEPIADSSMICTALLSQQIREHATVALGGDGCDELFGGYKHYQWLLNAAKIRRLLPAASGRWIGQCVQKMVPAGVRGRNFALAVLADKERACALINPVIDQSRRQRMLSRNIRKIIDFRSTERAKIDLIGLAKTPLQAGMRCDFQTYLIDNILCKVDRSSMAYSLETRAPWLDHRIIEFAFQDVPDHLKVTAEGKKLLPAALCKRYLPKDFDSRRKQGFSIPLKSWMSGKWGENIYGILRESQGGILNNTEVERMITENKRGRDHSQRLFSLALLEIWRKRFSISLPGEFEALHSQRIAA